MTIDEAIKILTNMGTPIFSETTERIIKARKLGVEALTYIKLLRVMNPRDVPALFHGETKE